MNNNNLRTWRQTLNTTAEAIDFAGKLAHDEDVKAVSIKLLSGDCLLRGNPTDQWVDIGGGISINIDFDKTDTASTPQIKSTSTGEVGIFATVYVRG